MYPTVRRADLVGWNGTAYKPVKITVHELTLPLVLEFPRSEAIGGLWLTCLLA
jgi:hypothetical protein